jgi:hypothetical protein
MQWLRFGTKGSEQSAAVNKMVPNGFNSSDFQTLQCRWHRKSAGALAQKVCRCSSGRRRKEYYGLITGVRREKIRHSKEDYKSTLYDQATLHCKNKKSKNAMYRHTLLSRITFLAQS